MNKYLFFILPFLYLNKLQAQVLLNDNFDNYTVGNLGTDNTGVVPGQGNWFTEVIHPNPLIPNHSTTTIATEILKGKVLILTTQQSEVLTAKKDLSTFINQRTTGNNVIKFEIDYYTGSQYYMATNNLPRIDISLFDNNNKLLMEYRHIIYQVANYIAASVANGFGTTKAYRFDNGNNSLPIDTWISLIVYLDYNNKKIYFETPYFNKVVVGDFLNQSTSNNLIGDFKPTSISLSATAQISNATQMDHKFDNIKVTALKAVPANILSVNKQLAAKFNLYPNPATNVVNITNAENMLVQQVTIYDITGKQLSTQIFNNQAEIQLNVENLASGTYMLHLQTNEGTAFKKLVKK